MNILISNDDGFQSKGILILADVVSQFANVLVFAPDKDMTASSSSLTLSRPLKINRSNNGFYHANGTPADCINLALKVMKFKPDFIFSGINKGANLGDDTLYSGTLAAAIEGYLSGISSIAFSLNDKSDKYWDTAKIVVLSLIQFLTYHNNVFREKFLLNINIPKVASNALKGFKVVRLGRRKTFNNITSAIDIYGDDIYWLGGLGKALNLDYDTDFNAVANGYVSITPLTIDLTAHKEIFMMQDIFKNIKIYD